MVAQLHRINIRRGCRYDKQNESAISLLCDVALKLTDGLVLFGHAFVFVCRGFTKYIIVGVDTSEKAIYSKEESSHKT